MTPYYGQTFARKGSAVVGAVLEFANHAIVTLHMDADTDRDERRHLELYGDKGILRMGDPNTFCGENELFKVGSRPVIFPMTHGFRGEMRGLGAAEMAWSIEAGREQRAGTGLALHVLEAVCGIEESIRTGEVYRMKTSCRAPEPLPEGYVGNGFWETGEEAALQ